MISDLNKNVCDEIGGDLKPIGRATRLDLGPRLIVVVGEC